MVAIGIAVAGCPSDTPPTKITASKPLEIVLSSVVKTNSAKLTFAKDGDKWENKENPFPALSLAINL